ncbi:SRPBCC family protein [soil metagenome]
MRTMNATPEQVWNVLSDGWLYPLWVVGASRIRDVDATWPQVGAKIHHSIGVWPALIDDHTEVLDAKPQHSILLRAKGWPLGEAEVLITLTAVGSGTEVDIAEDAVAGPGVYTPQLVRTPVLKWRNSETLRRLAFIAEGRPTPKE